MIIMLRGSEGISVERSNKLNSQLDLWNKLNEGNTLQEVQQYIKDVI